MKYNRTYHLPFSPGATNDDKIANNSDLLIGKEIIITEKLDGENSCLTHNGVYARSHATFTTSPWSLKVRQLHDIIKKDIYDDIYLFGENMQAIHSIEYTELTSPFYLFGIRQNDIWFSWDKVEEFSYLLDIPTVPVLFKGKVDTIKQLETLTKEFVSGKSKLGGDIEGIVVRSSNMFFDYEFKDNVQKWVRKNHVQTDQHWTKNWKNAKIKTKY